MEVSDILAKEGIKELIGEDGVAMLSGLQTTLAEMQKKIADADAAIKSRDAQKANANAKAEELQKELDKIRESGMSEVEKMEAALKKSEEERSKLMGDFTSMREEVAREKRANQLSKIAGDIHFIDALPSSTSSAIIEKAFADVDLSDASAVNGILETLKAENKAILKGSVPDGSGTHASTPAPAPMGKLTPEAILSMSDEDFQASKEDIFRQAGPPAI